LSPFENAQEWIDRGLEDKLLPDDENYRLHVVNCVSVRRKRKVIPSQHFFQAYFFCSECIHSGKWSEEHTGECKKCGINKPRMNTWTAADGGKPLNSFLNWLLNELPGGAGRKQSTYAIAHYGGYVPPICMTTNEHL
jgi:hypothetical protein